MPRATLLRFASLLLIGLLVALGPSAPPALAQDAADAEGPSEEEFLGCNC